MRRSIPVVLLASILTVVLTACAGEGSDPSASADPEPEAQPGAAQGDPDPAPSHTWPLEVDGEPAVGDVGLTFDGSVDVTESAAVFDGASGSASTSAPGPIDTTASFSVAAWVSLHEPTDAGEWGFNTTVSQIGDVAAAFYLGLGYGRWNFAMKDADTNEPGHTVRASATIGAPDPDVWVHLVGVHDHDAGELRFYLDGARAGVEPFTASWRAEGPLTIGRSQAHGGAADFWPGAIADVQVFATALEDDEVSRLTEGTRPATPPPPGTPVAAPDAALPDGTYEYPFTEEEAEAAGFDGDVTTSLRFEDGTWEQFFTVSPARSVVVGDAGLYRVEGDRLILTNPDGDVVYRWSLEGDTLSLELLELFDPEERDIVSLITEHNYTQVAP